MILNGLLPTHIQPNGQMLLKVTIVTLAFILLLSGCSVDWWVGDGRGDWTLDLCAGYSIVKINSREILLGYKESPDAPGRSIISNYFITAYQVHDPYIFLEGIQTQKITISDDELRNRVLKYYLVDTTDGEVVGPFESYDGFVEHCSFLGLEIKEEWIKTKNPD